MTEQLLIWIPLLPLFAAAIVGLFGRFLPRSAAHVLTILAVGASFVLSAMVFKATLSGFQHNADLYTWLVSGDIRFSVGFLIDNLSAMMMVVVTFVSLMVHIYTIGYMHDDAAFLWLGSRWFGFLLVDWLLVYASNRNLCKP